MKIKVTEERECCQPNDLRAVYRSGGLMNMTTPLVKFCIHCGRRHHYESFMDAAGSTDFHYVPQLEEWERKKLP